jgi:methylmalonyl-CoA mutase cobalamin-binding subunit
MKTLPNIKQTADVQDVVQYALLDTLKNSLDSAIAIDSGTYDISGLAGQYKKLTDKIKELENKIVNKNEIMTGGMSTATGTAFYNNY